VSVTANALPAPEKHPVVGVIGGLGPHATVNFLSALLAHTAAERAADHLHVLVDCNPKHPDVNASLLGTGPSIAPDLCAAARKLEIAGATLLAMVCNAAHAYATQISQAVRIPLVSMIEVAAERAAANVRSGGKVGVMATRSCIASGIYQRALIARGLRAVTLEVDEMNLLAQTLSTLGREPFPVAARTSLTCLADRLAARGAEVVIAGCTEIPLVLCPDDLATPLLDPVTLLAIRCIEAAGARVARSD
jgi:aspartate racemase